MWWVPPAMLMAHSCIHFRHAAHPSSYSDFQPAQRPRRDLLGGWLAGSVRLSRLGHTRGARKKSPPRLESSAAALGGAQAGRRRHRRRTCTERVMLADAKSDSDDAEAAGRRACAHRRESSAHRTSAAPASVSAPFLQSCRRLVCYYSAYVTSALVCSPRLPSSRCTPARKMTNLKMKTRRKTRMNRTRRKVNPCAAATARLSHQSACMSVLHSAPSPRSSAALQSAKSAPPPPAQPTAAAPDAPSQTACRQPTTTTFPCSRDSAAVCRDRHECAPSRDAALHRRLCDFAERCAAPPVSHQPSRAAQRSPTRQTLSSLHCGSHS